MRIIGLTGGIASGKSTARGVLESKGAFVIDADKLGHLSYEPGQKAYNQVVHLFGKRILLADGTINRKALGDIVFGSPSEMDQLQNAVWPCIREMIQEKMQEIQKAGEYKHIVVEAAVLLEAKWDDLMDEIWVIAVDPKVARCRLMARNNLSEDDANKRISAQMTNQERMTKAHVVIWNNGSQEELIKQVIEAWSKIGVPRKAPTTPFKKQIIFPTVLFSAVCVVIGIIIARSKN